MQRSWLRLLITALLGTASCASVPLAASTMFTYRSESGQVAALDLGTMTVRTDRAVIQFADCSNSQSTCWTSAHARFEVPRHCETSEAVSSYITEKGEGLRFLSLEGLSGNILKFETSEEKFAYGYHPSNGVVQLIIVPPDNDVRISEAGIRLRPFIYRIAGPRGPFPCRAN